MLEVFGTIILGSLAVIAASVAVVFIVATGKGIHDTLKK